MTKLARVNKVYSIFTVLLFNIIILFFASEMIYRLVQGKDIFSRPGSIEQSSVFIEHVMRIPYYKNMENAEQLWHNTYEVSFNPKYRPYTTWRHGPFESEHLNIDDNFLRVTPGADCSPDAYRVFVFGGSTMWGVGSPDDV